VTLHSQDVCKSCYNCYFIPSETVKQRSKDTVIIVYLIKICL
jgi:hypothetical protein